MSGSRSADDLRGGRAARRDEPGPAPVDNHTGRSDAAGHMTPTRCATPATANAARHRWTSRDGYRARPRDTCAGGFELADPKLRTGSYVPEWLLPLPRRADQALTSGAATS